VLVTQGFGGGPGSGAAGACPVGWGGVGRRVWGGPGGGVAGGETAGGAGGRELFEEVGFVPAALGPLIWIRTVHPPLDAGRWDGGTGRIYLVRTRAFDPAPGLSWDRLHAEGMTAVRWWTIGELEAAEARFAPRRLPLRDLIRRGPPAEPVDVGV